MVEGAPQCFDDLSCDHSRPTNKCGRIPRKALLDMSMNMEKADPLFDPETLWYRQKIRELQPTITKVDDKLANDVVQ